MPKESETTTLKVDESDGCLVMRRMSSGVVANLELENAPSFLPSLPSFLPSLPLEVGLLNPARGLESAENEFGAF